MDKWPHWASHEVRRWALWALAVVASFGYLEWRGMKRRDDADPTLTGVISRYIPGWAWYAALGAMKGWLDWHFGKAYESWETERPDVPR